MPSSGRSRPQGPLPCSPVRRHQFPAPTAGSCPQRALMYRSPRAAGAHRSVIFSFSCQRDSGFCPWTLQGSQRGAARAAQRQVGRSWPLLPGCERIRDGEKPGRPRSHGLRLSGARWLPPRQACVAQHPSIPAPGAGRPPQEGAAVLPRLGAVHSLQAVGEVEGGAPHLLGRHGTAGGQRCERAQAWQGRCGAPRRSATTRCNPKAALLTPLPRSTTKLELINTVWFRVQLPGGMCTALPPWRPGPASLAAALMAAWKAGALSAGCDKRTEACTTQAGAACGSTACIRKEASATQHARPASAAVPPHQSQGRAWRRTGRPTGRSGSVGSCSCHRRHTQPWTSPPGGQLGPTPRPSGPTAASGTSGPSRRRRGVRLQGGASG